MKKFLKIFLLIILLGVLVFYYFKKDQINNYLDPTNTKIEVINNNHDFGKITMNDTLQHVFYVKNHCCPIKINKKEAKLMAS
jgi:cellobiose-specific phosphotransferase system component IIB